MNWQLGVVYRPSQRERRFRFEQNAVLLGMRQPGTPHSEFSLSEGFDRNRPLSYVALRRLLSHVGVVERDIANHLQDGPTFAYATKQRQRFSGATDEAVSPAQLAHEMLFAIVLQHAAGHALRQRCATGYLVQYLLRCVPELRAYQWYAAPGRFLAQFDHAWQSLGDMTLSIARVGELYQAVLPPAARRESGQYYTPVSVVNHLLDVAGFVAGEGATRQACVVDVATGFGAFLAEAARRLVAAEPRARASTQCLTLANAISGYDLSPIAVIATKIHVLLAVIETLNPTVSMLTTLLEGFSLPLVRVGDTLAMPLAAGIAPTFIIGNPPFGSAPAATARDQDVAKGRANYAALFTAFALRTVALGGCVALLVPESLRSGSFHQPLRTLIAEQASLTGLVNFLGRKAVFPGVQHGIVGIVLTRSQVGSDDSVRVSTITDAVSAQTTSSFPVPVSCVSTGADLGNTWLKASTADGYALLNRLLTLPILDRIDLHVHTGRFIWNRHADELVDNAGALDVLPVIYAPCIDRYTFSFPAPPKIPSRAPYARASELVAQWCDTDEAILVQRTTSPEQARRLLAAMLPAQFRLRWPRYLLENHVNVLTGATCRNEPVSLSAVLGVLNSALLNFMFAGLSGSNHVSAWELRVLPLRYDRSGMLARLAEERQDAGAADPDRVRDLERRIDAVVYDLYGLSTAERALVAEFHTAGVTSAGYRIVRPVTPRAHGLDTVSEPA